MKWLLVAMVAAGTTFGDVMQSKGMRRHGQIREFGLGSLGRVARTLVREPLLILAICGYAIAFFGFLRLVSITPLSFAVPATAASYVCDMILGWYLLKERVRWQRWAGALLVTAGVVLLGL